MSVLDSDAWTVCSAAAALEAGRCSAAELCEWVAARRGAVDAELHAYSEFDLETALRAAEESDSRRAAGEARSTFDGVPLVVKDNLSVAGRPCTCASRILEGYTAPYDATAVARLKDRGFVILGRANMDEFAMGSTCETSAYGPTLNPWGADRVPGGSSGGTAAAVAAAEAIAGLGSDTGGSIRQPAAFCGVVGLKPSYGRVSRYGLVAYASSLDQIGPITRTVEDAAVLLQAISGGDTRDCTSLPEPVPDYRLGLNDGVRGLRLGLPREYLEVEGLAPDVREAVERAAAVLADHGAEVVPVSLPHTEYAIATYYIIATAEASANLARFDGIRYGRRAREEALIDVYRRTRGTGFGDEVKRRIILGTYVLSSGYYDAYYLRAQKVRTLIRNDFTQVFASCDALLAPVSPTTAPMRGGFASPLEMYLADIYTISANLAGICGLSVPCGLDRQGLPIGLQILGPALGEQTVLRVGRVCEDVLESVGLPPLAAAAGGGLGS
jgi:aspartyl-tRNA(Asn)/glutamyl-tRNA(Gln) amidotransferase subunit A